MFRRLRKTLTDLRQNRSGNAVMLVALGMPVLIGGAGLAVDTAQWYLWKREMQHAVDQAAIGAAWALSKDEAKAHYKTRARQEFNANTEITEDFVRMNEPELRDFAGGTDNSVVVSAVATRKLPFSSVILDRTSVIRVSAQASFQQGLDHNACLVALAEDEGSVLDIGGNATVKARCGLAALSCEEDAITIDGSATVETDSIATCGTASVPSDNEDVVTEGVDGLEDIYDDLVPPDNPTARDYECQTYGSKSNKYKLASLEPGTYSGLVVKCTTVLASGIYVIDGGELDLTANYDVTGTNVMFVLKNGARLKFGGNGNGNKVTLTPMQAADFAGTPYASQADRLAGMLVFEHRDNNVGNPGHKMNGNSNSIIEGLMYFPDSEIEIQGTADITAQCLQISAWKIKVTGNAYLETLCPTEETTSVGHSLAQIRLVA